MKVTLRKRKKANGDYSLFLDYYSKGKREYEFLKLYLTKDKRQNKHILELANKIRAKRELQISSTEYGFRINRLDENFIDYFQRIADTKTKNRKNYISVLNYIINFTGKDKLKFSDIDYFWLEKFKIYLLNKMSNNTARGCMNLLNYALKQALKDEIITVNPFDRIENIRYTYNTREYLTYDEVLMLLKTKCIDDEVKRAFLFSCFTGLRRSDVINLKWKNIKKVNSDNSENTQYQIELIQEKTGQAQYQPLNKSAVNLIGKPGKADEPVFNLPSISYMSQILKFWVKQAGINKPITFHSSRHTFATLSLTYGVDIYTVSKLLGHSNIETTQIYAKIIDEKKRSAVNQLPEIEV